MNFEDAYNKLKEGTATDEEAAFVARELENVRKISAILDNPGLSDPGFARAKNETVQKARKAFNRKAAIRTIGIVICCLAVIAALVCSILFIPSNISASKSLSVSKDQAREKAYACLVEMVGEEEAKEYYVDYNVRHLRYTGSIFKAVYVYVVEFENSFGREYEIEVNGHSGYAVVRDINLD